MSLTGYEQMKLHRKRELEQSMLELERLANAHQGESHYLSQEAFKLGLKFAIRQIEGTEMIHQKAFNELPFSNPKEAEREHKNQMNTLAVLKKRLIDRYEEKP